MGLLSPLLSSDYALSGTYVPQTQETIWVPAASFGATVGTPSFSTSGGGRWRSMLFDAAATETAACAVDLPAYIENIRIELFWTNQGAGTGDVAWFLNADGVIAGATLNATGGIGSSGELVIAAPAQDVLKVSSLLSVAVDPAKLLNLRFSRVGGSASDTLANDAAVLGMMVTPF